MDARRGSGWLLVGMALCASSSARAEGTGGAPGGDACRQLVNRNVQVLRGSALMEFQLRPSAHETMRRIVDALGRDPPLGAGWREGGSLWEEAYAILSPDVLAHQRDAGMRSLRYLEANLPRLLDPETCRKHMTLLGTKAGRTADTIDTAAGTKEYLDQYEKAFPVPARLKPWAEKARQESGAGLALLSSAEYRRNEEACRKARELLHAYGKRYAEAQQQLGDLRSEEDRKASEAQGQQVFSRHRDEIREVLRRAREAQGQ